MFVGVERRSAIAAVAVQAWREPPALATPVAFRYTSGFFYTLGGLLMLIGGPLLGSPEEVDLVGILGVGLAGLALGIVGFTVGHRLPRQAFVVLVLTGAVLITLVVGFGGGGAPSISLTAPYLLAVASSALLFPLREAVPMILFIETLSTAAMAYSGASAGDIIIVEGATIGMGAIVAWLTRVADGVVEDPLTRLLNRRGFDRRLDEEIARFRRTGSPLSVVVLDIDHFKSINDEGGHARGDRILTEAARAWRAAVPPEASLARYGGDEFALLLPGWRLGPAADLADRLRSLVPRGVTVSSGVAVAQPDDSGSMLYTRADVSLYDAKAGGRDRTVAHGDPARSASELEHGIAQGQLTLHLQPIVQLSTDEVVGYEALVRWLHPVKGLVPPCDFVPEAERTGAIHSLGTWVREEAARLAMTAPGPRRSVGINISVHELRTEDYADRIADLLRRWDMPGDTLVVEVTESVFDDDDPLILQNLRGLRELGVIVAIDDFGAGYSSLRRLAELPIDLIKVDGSLIQTIRSDSYDAPILEAIVTMARSLGVRLVAERVETAHEAAVLNRLGYDLVQGYLFGRPMPR